MCPCAVVVAEHDLVVQSCVFAKAVLHVVMNRQGSFKWRMSDKCDEFTLKISKTDQFVEHNCSHYG